MRSVSGWRPCGDSIVGNCATGQGVYARGTVKHSADGTGILRLTGSKDATVEGRAAFQSQCDSAFAAVANGKATIGYEGQTWWFGDIEKAFCVGISGDSHEIGHAGFFVAANVQRRIVFNRQLFYEHGRAHRHTG